MSVSSLQGLSFQSLVYNLYEVLAHNVFYERLSTGCIHFKKVFAWPLAPVFFSCGMGDFITHNDYPLICRKI